MLDQNRAWLAQSNKPLLEGYKEQPPIPEPELQDLRCVKMSHEVANAHLPDDYISPVFYQKQVDVINSIDESHEVVGELRFCVIGGTKGGHLINQIDSKYKIKHLCVIETSMESFYHSLSITDWPELFQKYNDNGGTIYFHIGEVTLEVKQRIAQHLQDIGTYNASNIFMGFDGTERGAKAVSHVVQCLQDCINSLGFYDDERVGLAHSIFKLQKNARFLRGHVKPWIEKPAMVCGNGPSLSKALPQIKRHRDHMTLIACGTAIGTLYRAGVKPDFYIEQERPKITSNATKKTTTPEFRDGITCIGLNVAHPQTHSMFSDIAYVLKANDFGAIVAKAHLHEAPQLMFVNPMVANAGTSIASSMGFKHIYLVGTDCAFGKDGASHSKGHFYKTDNSQTRTIPGNFRDEVESIQPWIESAKALELVIRANLSVSYYNLADGAKINGARPTKKFKPRGAKPVSKTQIMAPFKAFDGEVDTEYMRKSFTGLMYRFSQTIESIPVGIKSREEAFFWVDSIYAELSTLKKEATLFWYLIKGTMTTQLVFLATCADLDLKAFDKASANLKELARYIHQEIKDDLFRWDTWEDNGMEIKDVNRPD